MSGSSFVITCGAFGDTLGYSGRVLSPMRVDSCSYLQVGRVQEQVLPGTQLLSPQEHCLVGPGLGPPPPRPASPDTRKPCEVLPEPATRTLPPGLELPEPPAATASRPTAAPPVPVTPKTASPVTVTSGPKLPVPPSSRASSPAAVVSALHLLDPSATSPPDTGRPGATLPHPAPPWL